MTGAIEAADTTVCALQVAPGVVDRQEEFFVCAVCGKVYWQGSHWDKAGRGKKK